MARILPLILMALAFTLMATGAGSAQQRTQHQPGVFDHYLLALTWMPSFCAFTGDARADTRCAPGQRRGWQVHGLWPQHADGGWPEFCRAPHRNPSRQETARQADLFGTSGAAWHQWNKHGTCTGLNPTGYYALTRAAAEGLTMPDVFDAVSRDLRLAPQVIEDAFIEANPGMTADMLLVTCRSNAIYELRLCLTRDLTPRACAPQTLRRTCVLGSARLPALR